MSYFNQRLRVQTLPLIIFLLTFISLNGLFSEASPPKNKKELKNVKFVQKGQPPYVASSNPGQYFRHLQTTVEQDSSSSSDELSEVEKTHPKITSQKYRFVHAPVGYEKSKSSLLAEIKSLKEENEKLSEEVKAQAQKIKSLMSENKTLKEEVENGTKKQQSLNYKIFNLEESIKKKEKENTHFSTIVKQNEKNIRELKTEISSLEQKLKESSSNLEFKEKILLEKEEQINNKVKDIGAKEEEIEKMKKLQNNEIIKLKEKVSSLTNSVENLNSEQATIEDEKRLLEAKIEEMKSELEKSKEELKDCLESLNANQDVAQSEAFPKTAQKTDPRKSVFDTVIKQMNELPAKTKWVKAPPLKRPEGIQPEVEATPEIEKVFKSMKKKKELDFANFVTEHGLENESIKEQRRQFMLHKEVNIAPSVRGIQQFSRFKKETSNN